ncbi:hypothetical protein TRL7639_04519 [Falsiruegeria litorea R37]|uniref:Exopolysaccharide biosynthesis protein YbjH n=1 Tax=Falsiruegeria litorea R37 TaxID=1200284 RepID=A0A1Y5TVJ9_9RHOB|nr:YjbH domain-containing protein [Falsiruegeria litorea]SLN74266.1 hypothetical protein TRL7639_04519 [Falsiruegeria litorea R37]
MRLGGIVSGLVMLCSGAVFAEDAPETTADQVAQAAQTGQSPQVAQEEPKLEPLPQTTLNFYGMPGIVDMPSAEMLPEGQFATTVSNFGGQTRITLAFQPFDWMTASFRYVVVEDWNIGNFPTYYDRSFDVRMRLFKETRRFPSVTLGLRDLAGTGIYAGEFIAATKTFNTQAWGTSRLPGRLKVTAGLGWGRLGSYGSFGSTGNRPARPAGDLGGNPGYSQWFRGPVAAFGGIEWQANDRLGFKVEYSSDAYVTETQTTSVFERRSPFNFGVEYQWTPRTRVGAYYLYGSEIGVNFQIQLSPYKPNVQPRLPAPYPVQSRPDPQVDPVAWSTEWTASTAAVAPYLRDQLAPLLVEDGLLLEALDISAETAELRFRNLRYGSNAVAIGRAARAMTRVLPASIEIFRLTLVSQGLPLSTVVIHRSDLEQLEFENFASDQMLVETRFTDPRPLSEAAVQAEDLYPNTSWSVAPYFTPGFFDVTAPLRLDVGVSLRGSYQPAPGWVIAGRINQRLFGNLDGGTSSATALPPVRTDRVLYAQYGTTLNQLYLARYWKPSPDLYARVTAGYFEYGYGGLSTELLWKPVNSRLALGVEANYALKRDYDQLFGFRDYRVATGHASAYYDFENGFLAQLDVGRYLAGDFGATLGIDRVFNNGWSVGGFFTRTNVSAAEFGEGSFDKGIRFRIPVTWFLGSPSKRGVGTTIRPIQRDGGARVHVPGRLYNQVRGAHRNVLSDQWPRFWE